MKIFHLKIHNPLNMERIASSPAARELRKDGVAGGYWNPDWWEVYTSEGEGEVNHR